MCNRDLCTNPFYNSMMNINSGFFKAPKLIIIIIINSYHNKTKHIRTMMSSDKKWYHQVSSQFCPGRKLSPLNTHISHRQHCVWALVWVLQSMKQTCIYIKTDKMKLSVSYFKHCSDLQSSPTQLISTDRAQKQHLKDLTYTVSAKKPMLRQKPHQLFTLNTHQSQN